MSNTSIEKAGRDAVRRYEERYGRTVVLGQGGTGTGYDFMTRSRDGKEVRIIEVKSTNRDSLGDRWLEPLEYRTMMAMPDYWLYAVLRAESDPHVKPFCRKELAAHFAREEVKRWYSFKRRDFEGAEIP